MRDMLSFFQKGLDIHYVLRNGFWLFLEKGILTIKGIVLIYIFANYVEQDTFGKQQFLFSLFGILSVFSIPGLTSGIVNAVSRGKEGVLKDATRSMLRMSLFGSIILVLYAGYVWWFLGDGLFSLTVLMAAPFFPSYAAMSIVRAYYVGKENFGSLARVSITVEFFSFFLTLIAISFSSIFYIVAASIVFPSIVYIVLLFKMIRKIPIHYKSDAEELSFGKRLSFSYVIMTASSYADRAIVGSFLGFNQLSLFSVSQSIPDQVKAVIASISALAFPKLSKYITTDHTIHKKIWYIFISGTVFLSFIFVMYMILSTQIFSLLFPKFGAEAVRLSLVFMASTLFSPIIFLDTYFRSRRLDTIVNKYTILSSSLMIVLLFILTPMYGVFGAALSKVLSSFAGWVYILHKFLKIAK